MVIPLWNNCQNQTISPQLTTQDSISVDSLKMMVWSLPFKHKDIVIAQAILETGWFKSKNFKINNNLFGMKQVYFRMTLADTVINGYSHYPNLKQCLYDYCIKQLNREEKIPTNREQYFRYLDKIYSEMGTSYSSQLKDIIYRLHLDNDDPTPVVVKHTKQVVNKKHLKHKKKLGINTECAIK